MTALEPQRLADLICAKLGKPAVHENAVYSPLEAARLVSITPCAMRRKLVAGEIRGSRRLGRWRVRGAELLKLV